MILEISEETIDRRIQTKYNIGKSRYLCES
jgi:hypothetical protein